MGAGGAQNYVRTNQWVFWVSWGLSLVAILAIGFSKTLRYKTPWNYLFLVILPAHLLLGRSNCVGTTLVSLVMHAQLPCGTAFMSSCP